uniref:Cytochrome c domain-containing protein n=1 Tax=viral metagenome TaxID=1070528 RepID=A0A6H1ZXK5_9ZZZZ
MERPSFCEDEHLEYLDDLRESGDTNMYGATPYLQGGHPEFTKTEARGILSYWMKSFGNKDR